MRKIQSHKQPPRVPCFRRLWSKKGERDGVCGGGTVPSPRQTLSPRLHKYLLPCTHPQNRHRNSETSSQVSPRSWGVDNRDERDGWSVRDGSKRKNLLSTAEPSVDAATSSSGAPEALPETTSGTTPGIIIKIKPEAHGIWCRRAPQGTGKTGTLWQRQ